MAAIFLCHGGPTLVTEVNEYTAFLKQLGEKLNPKAIVIFTAHWEKETTTISSVNGTYDMIYDFYGFPKELYNVKYPAKGSVEVAGKVQQLLSNRGIESTLDETRGLDHGAWDVLYLMYPQAEIPVVQVSVNPRLSVEKQYEIGKALSALGDEDILVIGSGSTVHNLSTLNWDSGAAEAWAVEFDDWLIKKVESQDDKALFNYRQLAPHAKRAVPTEEHIDPLFIAMGSGNKKPKLLHQSYIYGTLSYLCFEF